jgi:hypothetical protein
VSSFPYTERNFYIESQVESKYNQEEAGMSGIPDTSGICHIESLLPARKGVEGMQASIAEVRSQYLALALSARRVLDALVSFAQTGSRTPDLEAALASGIETLALQRNPENVFAGLTPLGTSAQQAVIADIQPTRQDRDALLNGLRQLAESKAGKDQDEQRATAKRAIQFFFVLEGRALSKYNQLASEHAGFNF